MQLFEPEINIVGDSPQTQWRHRVGSVHARFLAVVAVLFGVSLASAAAAPLAQPAETENPFQVGITWDAGSVLGGIDWEVFPGSYSDSNPIIIPFVHVSPTAATAWSLYE